MTQSIGDFTTLQNKYRHAYKDKKGELKSKPMGAYWIGSQERRQYDGGMAFMPQRMATSATSSTCGAASASSRSRERLQNSSASPATSSAAATRNTSTI